MILLLTETLTAGGAEIFVLRMSRQLSQLGYPNIVLNFNKNLVNRDLLKKYVDVEIIHHTFFGEWFVRKIDRLFFKLHIDVSIGFFFLTNHIKSVVSQRQVSVVHTHLFNVDYTFSKINTRLKLRHVITNHGDYRLLNERVKKGHKESVLNFASKARMVFESASSVICISRSQQTDIINTYGFHLSEKLKIIYNGFDREEFKSKARKDLLIHENDFVFGMVARGIKEKGWRFAIEAFQKLEASGAHLILVGDGEYLGRLLSEIEISKNIHWVGFSEMPLQWISIFNVGLLPSYYDAESQPNVVLEYLSLAKPVICSDVGDMNIILNTSSSSAQCGYVIPIENGVPEIDVAKLKTQMTSYMDDAVLYEKHSVSALKRFNDFEMKECAKKYIKEYFPLTR